MSATGPAALGAARDRTTRDWMVPLTAWAASRLLIVVLALGAAAVFGLPERGVDPAVPHALSYLGGWDTTWYLDVARHGYEHDSALVGSEFTNLAFFPLLPGVMAAALALGLNPFLTALVVGHLAFLAALVGVHRLSRDRLGERGAVVATWVMALAPPALAASQAYTEALALALVVWAALWATRDRYALAGLAAGVATLARPTGAVAALLVALLAVRTASPGRLRRAALGVVPSVVALGAFLGWMQVERGSWRLPFRAQEAWDRGGLVTGLVTDLPNELRAAWDHVAGPHFDTAWTASIRDVGFGVLFALLLARLWRTDGGIRSPWVAYSALVLALPLASGTVTSLARFGLLAFPLAWPAAEWIGEDRGRRVWSAAAAVTLTALLVAQIAVRSP